jgi:aspartyl-tRNA(Asn)/glutamyl-tRNA(Gln) amidotransferase subunit B
MIDHSLLLKYEPVIGLEVHAQLKTKTKIFCGCSAEFTAVANKSICPICLGHPGTLPVLNKKVVEFAVKLGLSLDCKINLTSIFARKNYFYPDLPKGYQISQFSLPICGEGTLSIDTSDGIQREIGILRAHLEEDAGKSIHDRGDFTLVDVNRCGVPLIEIVSQPDLRSGAEAATYLRKIRQIVVFLGICDGNMEEGSLRCDANISVRLRGEVKLGTKTEVKNMNSFKNVEKAINFEIERQINMLEDGEKITQQTLLWNADKSEAFQMRSKEDSHDYRYFPDPDLIPIVIDENWFDSIKASMPELPADKKKRYIRDFNLPEYDSEVLTQSPDYSKYFEDGVSYTSNFKEFSNWMMTEVLKIANDKKIQLSDFTIEPPRLAKLTDLIASGVISGKIAKEVFLKMIDEPTEPEEIVKREGMVQISDERELEIIIEKLLTENQSQVKEYLDGKEKVLGFFIGKIMKETKGKANPTILNRLLLKMIKK